MAQADIVLVLGSGPNAPQAQPWPRAWFDRVVAINNAWRIRPDWDDLVIPEDFPADRWPTETDEGQRLIKADAFVPAQNAYGGFVYAGGTMAFTTAYWVLHALRPRVMAFLGCDMVYPASGPTHFYGTGRADPLRPDVTLRDLKAKSARLGLLAAAQECACVNLSEGSSELVFKRATAQSLRGLEKPEPVPEAVAQLQAREEALGFFVPSGRYWEVVAGFDADALAALDTDWLAIWQAQHGKAAA